jgi:hypothetical protein
MFNVNYQFTTLVADVRRSQRYESTEAGAAAPDEPASEQAERRQLQRSLANGDHLKVAGGVQAVMDPGIRAILHAHRVGAGSGD